MTKQLLAFTRKQVLQPQVIDLNELVLNVNGLLGSLIGEDIELVTRLAPEVHPIEADSGQLEQVIVNLAVNARDAMPRGGTLTIATADVEVADGASAHRRELEPGAYVTLSVADTGDGMDTETLRQIFEPFFTTKEEGKGTGLGLATAFGIVKQSGGDIQVESEPGAGTTFTICLPRARTAVARSEPAHAPAQMRGGSETVLLVEDEELVRYLEHEVLRRHGYRVLEAAGPEHAIELARAHPGHIDLLLTDIVMPGMSGVQLAQQLLRERPDMKVLYASGYAAEMIEQRGILAPGTDYLPKPLTPASIAGKVREVLDAEALRRAS
jgi:CheY-like chemotaxis protein